MRHLLTIGLLLSTMTLLAQNHQIVVKGSTTCATTQTYTLPHGSMLILHAQPDSGYVFKQWSDGVTANPRKLLVLNDATFEAEYEEQSSSVTPTPPPVPDTPPTPDTPTGEVPKYKCNIEVDECGTVFTGEFVKNTPLVIHAKASDCGEFVKWSDGNTDNPRTITVTNDINLKAEFLAYSFVIRVESADPTQGSVSVEIK